MTNLLGVTRNSIILLAAIILAGCANNPEPAQKMIAQVQSALSAAQPDAQKYVPDKLKDVEGKVARLNLGSWCNPQ
jgi:PBP1b-binding outer membrane lipoprotein LpoB